MEDNKEKLEKQAEIIDKELEIAVDLEEIKKEEVKVEGKVFYYTKTILSGVLDQIIALGLALVIYGIFDLVLKFAGFKIILKEEMFLIVYVISNMLYYPIIQEIFNGKTLGKKIMTR